MKNFYFIGIIIVSTLLLQSCNVKNHITAEEYNDKGMKELTAGHDSNAIAYFDTALRIDPTLCDVYNNKGLIENRMKKYSLALNDFDKSIELSPSYRLAYTNRSNVDIELLKYKEAINDCNKAIALDSNDYFAFNNRAIAEESTGDTNAAMTDYTKAIAIRPDGALAYTNRGLLEKNSGHYSDALKDYMQSIQLFPNDVNTLNSIGTLYYAERDYGKAEEYLTKIIELQPRNVLYYTNRGCVREDKGDKKGAWSDYQYAIQIDSTYGIAYWYMANIVLDSANYKRAIKLYTQALAKGKQYPSEFCKRGRAKFMLHDYDGALKDIDNSIKIDSTYSLAYTYRSDCEEKMGLKDASIQDRVKAKRLKQ